MFGVAVNEIWKDRNNLVFSQISNMGKELQFQVCNQSSFIQSKKKWSPSQGSLRSSNVIEVCWEAPPVGCIKINVDGFHNGKLGSTAVVLLETRVVALLKVSITGLAPVM